MLKIYDAQTARKTILLRQPLDDMPVPPSLQESITRLFGSPLTPAQVVDTILKDIRQHGDEALRRWTVKLDGGAPDDFRVPQEQLQQALAQLPEEQRSAFSLAADRVRKFHEAQPLTSWITQSLGGTLGQVVRPIRRVGLYVPAGSAPLPSSLLMAVVPAQVAGVSEIVLASPPQRITGEVTPIIMAVAALLGIHEVYCMGGAQAIAALAYGTESIRRVDKILGPGNIFVTLAKRQLFGTVGIDQLAGPTETVIIADDTARAEWVAADMLAQAEHDALASAVLLSPSRQLIQDVQQEINRQAQERSRASIITASFQNRSGAVLTGSIAEAIELANEYAPEHLCLAVADPWRWAEKVTAAGGIFLGEYSFEVLGDYVAGPSHIMPTGGTALFSSPLNVLDFIHFISIVALDPTTTRSIAPSAAVIGHIEGLDAHAHAAELRSQDEKP